MPPPARRVDVVWFDAGSGHRSAAAALRHALTMAHPDWRVRCVDLLDVLAGHWPLALLTRTGMGYINDMMAHERVRDLARLIRLGIFLSGRLSPRDHGRLGRFWLADPPDALVSVTPIYNAPLFHAFRRVRPLAPYVVIPVDLEEGLPGYWFSPGIGAHYLLGGDELRRQARQAGVPEGACQPLSGMVVDPDFYAEPGADRAERLRELGLDPTLPVVLASFGGQGSTILLRIARALASCRLNAIFLCGASQSVAARLRALPAAAPRLVLDYLPDTPVGYQRLADAVIGKPGTMTIFEALACGAPLLALKSSGMAPLQRGNERWLAGSGAGLVVDRVRDLPAALDHVLGHSAAFKAAAARHAGRGVFEAVEAIDSLLAGGAHTER